MRKSAFLLLILLRFLAPFDGFSQHKAVDSLFARSAGYLIERVHLHCDKYVVPAGDTLWWKAYIFKNRLPSTISTNLYVELFSSEGHLVAREMFPIFNGLSFGQLGIPDRLPPGIYWLRAYTRYQLNFDSADLFEAPIIVFHRNKQLEIPAKWRTAPSLGPFVSNKAGVLMVATNSDSGLVCHLEVNEGSGWLGREMNLVLASDHQPLMRATFTLSDSRRWEDLVLHTRQRRGWADLLLFCGDSLIERKSLYLGALPSAGVEVSTDTASFMPGGYNVWMVHINDLAEYNCSVSVTDADLTGDDPRTILQYQQPDPFDYGRGMMGQFPDTESAERNFLQFRGLVRTDKGSPVGDKELVALVSKDSAEGGKPILVQVKENGSFMMKGFYFYDSAWISYELNGFPDDPKAKNITLTLCPWDSPGFTKPDKELWREGRLVLSEVWPGDTSIPADAVVKELPPVTVFSSALKELDNRYAQGIFSEPTPYAFDLRTDKSVSSVWAYLRKNLPGFQGGLDIGQYPTLDQRGVLFYVDGQAQSLDDMNNYWYEEIAYIKAFPSLWVDESRFMQWQTGYSSFVLGQGDSTSGLKVPIQRDPPVICLYTRQGKDIRSGWPGLKKLKVAGYARPVKWSGASGKGATLYWEPLQPGNTFKLRFYNKGAERFRLCIEGVSDDGKVIHFETVISPPPSTAALHPQAVALH